MNWLLDTNVRIRYLNGRAPKLKQRIDACSPADLRVCSVVKAEMYFGAAQSKDPVRAIQQQRFFLSKFTSLVFDDLAADAYGIVRADLARRGVPIGPNDLLIASIAIANQTTLVTANLAEFNRVQGLTVENWEA